VVLKAVRLSQRLLVAVSSVDPQQDPTQMTATLLLMSPHTRADPVGYGFMATHVSIGLFGA